MKLSLLFVPVLLGLVALGASCDDEEPPPEPTLVAVQGVTITEVAIYQGLKRPLMAGGVETEGTVPLVAGRDAVVRVFYTTDSSYDGAAVVGRLEIDGAAPIEVSGALTSTTSSDGDITSTVNFMVPGDLVGSEIAYSVSLLQESLEASSNADARWPAEGTQSVTVEGPANTLKVMLTPIRYDFDGSGRLPDLSDAVVEQYRARLLELYPVSDVELTVREPFVWADEIAADGDGWDEIIAAFVALRDEDGLPDDVYYYGLFDPEEQLSDYCFAGCLLGATLLNGGSAEGDVGLRLGIGLGYPDQAVDTIAHELGHAHGRRHANCGPGIAPLSIDNGYPYEEGAIGVWGMNPVSLELHPPEATSDIMGYCPFQWVSDYTYRALLARGALVNSAPSSSRKQSAVVTIGKDGPRWVRTTRMSTQPGFYEFDHLPGGILFVPLDDADAQEIRVELDGVTHALSRPPLL